MNGNVELREERAAIPRRRISQTQSVIDYVTRHPEASVRGIGKKINIPKTTVHIILEQAGYHPFKKLRVQEFQEGDQAKRLSFCRWILAQEAANEGFCSKIIFTDECTFKNIGCYNHHNVHHWSIENPRAMQQNRSVQRQYKINVWAEIIEDKIIGPHEFEQNLNAATYASFLEEELPQLIEDSNVDPSSETIWFQQDGAPPHTSREARRILRGIFTDRLISKFEEIEWPPRSPDLNLSDFFLWGHLKNLIYVTPVIDRDDLMSRVNDAIQSVTPEMLQKTIQNFIKKCRLCVQFGGGHFEHDRRLRSDEDESDDEDSNANSTDSGDTTWRPED